MSEWSWLLDAAKIAIPAAVTIYGASQQQKALQQATNTAVQANTQSANQQIAAQNQATEKELAAIEEARQIAKQQQSLASPGLVRLQSIIGRGETLTPAQIQALDDARRTTLDALQGGSLRGSARATTAAVRDVEGRMRTDFMDQNRQAADQAASNLSGQYFNAGKNAMDLNLASGASASNGLTSVGGYLSGATTNTGQNIVDNTTGQANIQGRALGDIAAIIADQAKTDDNEKRDSQYSSIVRVA